MKADNKKLELWNQVSKTDPKFTKKSDKSGGHQFTSITPIYQIKKATEIFGVQGLGWGIIPESEKFHETTYGETTILNYDAILFFNYEEETGFLPIHASMKVAYQTSRKYLFIDDEARKKVVTNAKTKGLSELGFSADVFAGQFDDPNYVSMRQFESEIEKAEAESEERAQKLEDFNAWCKTSIQKYSETLNIRALNALFDKHTANIFNKATLLGLEQEPYIKQFSKAYQNQLTALKELKQQSNKEEATA